MGRFSDEGGLEFVDVPERVIQAVGADDMIYGLTGTPELEFQNIEYGNTGFPRKKKKRFTFKARQQA